MGDEAWKTYVKDFHLENKYIDRCCEWILTQQHIPPKTKILARKGYSDRKLVSEKEYFMGMTHSDTLLTEKGDCVLCKQVTGNRVVANPFSQACFVYKCKNCAK